MLGRSILIVAAALSLAGAAPVRQRDSLKCGRAIVKNALEVKQAGRGGRVYIPKGCRKVALPEGYRWGEMSKDVVSIVDRKTNETLARFVMNMPPARPEVETEIVRGDGKIEVWEEGRKVGTVTYSEEGGQ